MRLIIARCDHGFGPVRVGFVVPLFRSQQEVTLRLTRGDKHGRPIHLELCAACDADQPAAGALIL